MKIILPIVIIFGLLVSGCPFDKEFSEVPPKNRIEFHREVVGDKTLCFALLYHGKGNMAAGISQIDCELIKEAKDG